MTILFAPSKQPPMWGIGHFVSSSIKNFVVMQTVGRNGLFLNAKEITGFRCMVFVKKAKPE